MTHEQTKELIELIERGDMSAKEMAAYTDISYSGVITFRTKYNEAKLNNTLDTLINADEHLVEAIAGDIAKENEFIPAEEANKISKSVTGLKRLDISLQETANRINQQLAVRLNGDKTLELTDLVIITDILSTLQNSFFNKNVVQVAVQNNYGEDGQNDEQQSRYGDLLDSEPPKHN